MSSDCQLSQDVSRVRCDSSDSAARARANSGQALLAGMRFAASATAAAAASPRSSKSSSAARNSNNGRALAAGELDGGGDVGLACVRVVLGLGA